MVTRKVHEWRADGIERTLGLRAPLILSLSLYVAFSSYLLLLFLFVSSIYTNALYFAVIVAICLAIIRVCLLWWLHVYFL